MLFHVLITLIPRGKFHGLQRSRWRKIGGRGEAGGGGRLSSRYETLPIGNHRKIDEKIF